ncbi:TonB-dependent siderophore receptor [Methylomonas methanica]|uniref:TonB-dependent siderophore receptor n=1 Tax=Methylomonas methanica (strain DSM 25384 / MC09) TaxID=857087 RepID=G0A115_METMM|nr:TonB-dependent receptor [Methylomonas methanica]AEG01271.1 TonB-dependent siderophore receptor [Methylomonas methanica MC09]
MPNTLSTTIRACIAAAPMLISPAVQAESALRSYDIAAQPLSDALLQFSETSGIKVFFSTDLVKGVQSPSLQGSYGPQQALQKLLLGTGIVPRTTANGTVTLEKAAAVGPQSAAAATMSPVKVVGQAIYDPTDPYNPDYSLPNQTTGTKTDTPNMETPINVQVITKSVMNDQQTIKLSEVLKNVAGVVTSQGSGGVSDDIFLRGFRTSVQFRNGFRFDNHFSSLGTRQMANVERIEVTKGPAAILYGRLEPGGMINVVTKQPLAKPYYALQQQFGSFDLYRTTLDATGPITDDDTLLYRFNGSFESSGSFRELVDNERTFLAPTVTWNINPQTHVTLEMEYRHDRLGYDPQVWPFINGQYISMPRSRNLAERSLGETEEILIGLNWSHRFNDDWKIEHRFVADMLSSELVDTVANGNTLGPNNSVGRLAYITSQPWDENTYYTELNLTGHFDTGFLNHTLLVGGDYYRNDLAVSWLDATLNPINVFNPIHDDTIVSVVPESPSNRSADFFGLYAQDQITLPYGFHVMGGLRYQYVKQWDNLTGTSQPSDDAVTPRVGVLWQARDWLSVYGNYVENFGDSNVTARTQDGKPLPPQSAQQWEVGTKFEFFDGKLNATLAYFDLTKQNVQTPDRTNPIYSVAQGEVRSRGPEVDIRGELLPGWNVIATYANLDTRITKSNSDDLGSRLFAVPRNMGSLWSTYEFLHGDLKGLKFGGGLRLQDGSAGFNTPQETTGFATVDLLAAYSMKVGKSKITAQINVNNLLDKDYITSSFFTGADNRVTFGTPRSFLGSIKVEF